MTVTLRSDRPAAHADAVAFAADGAYARFALAAAARIARLHPERAFDICLCYQGTPPAVPPSLDWIGVRLCEVATPGTFDGLRLDPGRAQVVYLRLALPQAFQGDYRRLLYLDADIAVKGGDFAWLLRTELLGHPIAAVRDNSQWRAPRRRPAQFRRLGLPSAPYFNAGVMLIDVPAWNAADILARSVAFGRTHRDRLRRHDQNLLNAVLMGGWAELHPAWNWQHTRATALFEPFADAHIVHFIGPKKPWSDRPGLHPPAYRRAFAAFLAEHFPEAPPVPEAPSLLADGSLRAPLWRHLLATGPMAAYLGRFQDRYAAVEPG